MKTILFSLLIAGCARAETTVQTCEDVTVAVMEKIVRDCEQVCSKVNKRDRKECELSCRVQTADAVKIEVECE